MNGKNANEGNQDTIKAINFQPAGPDDLSHNEKVPSTSNERVNQINNS